MNTRILTLAFGLVLLSTLPIAAQDFACKRVDFVPEQFIRMDMTAGQVTVRDVKFEMPATYGPKKMEVKGKSMGVVSVKNYGKMYLRIHIAIALFDENGNLVGCGTTGSKMGSTGPGEEESFYVTFDYVRSKLSTAKFFYITLETAPTP
jgi:hypothetical protein